MNCMDELFENYLKHSGKILKIVTDEKFVKGIDFADEAKEPSKVQPEIIKQATLQLLEYLDGKRTTFDLPLAPDGTDFQKKVWNMLLTIPYGKTLSYAQMAEKLGNPKVIRAAASANGKNPISIVIPCHRVIGSDGSLVGYGGGLENKRFLLNLEKANGVLTLFD